MLGVDVPLERLEAFAAVQADDRIFADRRINWYSWGGSGRIARNPRADVPGMRKPQPKKGVENRFGCSSHA